MSDECHCVGMESLNSSESDFLTKYFYIEEAKHDNLCFPWSSMEFLRFLWVKEMYQVAEQNSITEREDESFNLWFTAVGSGEQSRKYFAWIIRDKTWICIKTCDRLEESRIEWATQHIHATSFH
jgi:hypothetical protein